MLDRLYFPLTVPEDFCSSPKLALSGIVKSFFRPERWRRLCDLGTAPTCNRGDDGEDWPKVANCLASSYPIPDVAPVTKAKGRLVTMISLRSDRYCFSACR